MKAVILAGGLGTRFAEETSVRPKPMIEVGGRPILWHILKIYGAHGINDFVICCGYKGYVIKEYFANYFLHMSDVTFDMSHNEMIVHQKRAEPWRVTLVDTGDDSMTGGRMKRVADHVKDEELFLFTYGDGVGDIDVTALDRLPPPPRQARHHDRDLSARAVSARWRSPTKGRSPISWRNRRARAASSTAAISCSARR